MTITCLLGSGLRTYLSTVEHPVQPTSEDHHLNGNHAYPVNGAALLLSIGPPKHEDQAVQILVQPGDHRISELLPALLLVGIGLVRSDSEDSIEQKHTYVANREGKKKIFNALPSTDNAALYFANSLVHLGQHNLLWKADARARYRATVLPSLCHLRAL